MTERGKQRTNDIESEIDRKRRTEKEEQRKKNERDKKCEKINNFGSH